MPWPTAIAHAAGRVVGPSQAAHLSTLEEAEIGRVPVREIRRSVVGSAPLSMQRRRDAAGARQAPGAAHNDHVADLLCSPSEADPDRPVSGEVGLWKRPGKAVDHRRRRRPVKGGG